MQGAGCKGRTAGADGAKMEVGEKVKIEQANSRHKLHKLFSQEKNGGEK